MDENGVPVHITQWKISLDVLQQNSKGVDTLEATVYKINSMVLYLTKLEHPNVVKFRNVSCILNDDYLTVYLTRDMINGVPVRVYSSMNNWTIRNVREICNVLVQTMTYLNNKLVLHGNINDSTIFMDNTGVWKMADYFINPYLNHIANGSKMPNTQMDLMALGDLIDSLSTTSLQVTSFVEKCRTVDNFSDLLDHPLLQSLHKSFDDFEVIRVLGSGGFGQVLKVKDCKVEKEYAIKRLKSTKKTDLTKGIKEVKALAELTHKNIVRYYRSWTETMNESEYKSYEESSDDEMDIDECSTERQRTKRWVWLVYFLQYIKYLCYRSMRNDKLMYSICITLL